MNRRLIIKLLREGLETYDGMSFHEDLYNYANNQSYIRCDVVVNDEVVAWADYSEYQNKIYINMIESNVKGKGYGKALMRHIAKLYGYENIERSMMTPDGFKMRKELDTEFNYTHQEVNHHIEQSKIENIQIPLVKAFLIDMVSIGYSKTWKKYLKYPEFKEANDRLLRDLDLDFNEVSDIAQWVQNASENDNDPNEEVPDVIIQDLNKLM